MANFEGIFDETARFEAAYHSQNVTRLGAGAFGEVSKVRKRNTRVNAQDEGGHEGHEGGHWVAMKETRVNAQDEGVPYTTIREIAILKQLSHPNVVKLEDVFFMPTRIVLIFELLDHDLKGYMRSQNMNLSLVTVKNLAKQLCLAMEFCHGNRIIHRDIKPQNLLVSSSAQLKVADFGLARAIIIPVPRYSHEVVTLWYRPPEILLGSSHYSVSVDIWSIGCVIAEMATGAPLFYGGSEIEMLFHIFRKLGTPSEQIWQGVSELRDYKATFPRWSKRPWCTIRNIAQQVGSSGIELLEELLCYDPAKRLSARRALQHAYFLHADTSAD